MKLSTQPIRSDRWPRVSPSEPARCPAKRLIHRLAPETPVEKADAETLSVFGDYIDVYGVRSAVEGTRRFISVPIYHESSDRQVAERTCREDPKLERGIRGDHRRRRVGTRKGRSERRSGPRSKHFVGGIKARVELVARRYGQAPRAPTRSNGRQGDDCVHEPPRLRPRLSKAIVKLRPEWANERRR